MDKFSYLIRLDISKEMLGAMYLLKNSLKIIIEQYNAFRRKQYEQRENILFPKINIDCVVNTDNKLIVKLDVDYEDDSLKYIHKLKNQIDLLENNLKQKEEECREKLRQKEKEYEQKEEKYKQKEEEYEKEKKEWERDSCNRAKEWSMIRSLAHSEKSLEKLDEKALAEQIYKKLRAEYNLDSLEINKENE